jgi:hypothetical protein
VVKREGTFYLWYKNETTKYIEYASSTSLTSGYTVVESGDWAGWGSGLEGMTLVHLEPDTWRIYFDDYNNDVFYWSESDDGWATWSAKTAVETPYYTQHPHILYADEVGSTTSGGGVDDHGDLSGLGDDDHTHYLTTGRHAALDHNALTTRVTVDAGTVTYSVAGADVSVTIATDWGIDPSTGPYYDDTGADAGEEAALLYDYSTGDFVVVPYNT